jgi:predicted nuclease of predicted toxin-antitoxin system
MAKATKHRKYKWRLYADNNVQREVVQHLRRSGMDVLWIAEDPDLRKQDDDAFHYRKAGMLGRYLLTRDLDFWDDRRHPLQISPGVIIVNTDDATVAKHLPILLRTLIQNYNPLPQPLYLRGIKVKLDSSGITLKMVDRDTGKVTTDRWSWNDLVGRRP